MSSPSNLKLPLLLALIASGAAAASCARRSEEAPSETAASQAPAPMAAPAESPEPPPPPPEPAPQAGSSPPSSFGEKAEEGRAGLDRRERELTTLPEAEKAFGESQRQIEQLIGPLEAEKAKGAGQAAAPLASGDARCPHACKAFESLRRAGDAICRLAGAADARCTRAKGVVKQSQARIVACGCSSNGSER
jgi:hypothetical protein